MKWRRDALFARQPSKYAIYQRLINSYRWQLLRKKKFMANPICEECKEHGRVTPAEEVHHVVPVETGKDEAEMTRLAYDYNNLRSLCKACHARAHAPKEKEVSPSVKNFFEKYLQGE